MNTPLLPFRALILTALIPWLLLSCRAPSNSAQDTDPNNAAFVTLLGDDTLAVERFVRTPTTVREYVLEMVRKIRTVFSCV